MSYMKSKMEKVKVKMKIKKQTIECQNLKRKRFCKALINNKMHQLLIFKKNLKM